MKHEDIEDSCRHVTRIVTNVTSTGGVKGCNQTLGRTPSIVSNDKKPRPKRMKHENLMNQRISSLIIKKRFNFQQIDEIKYDP